MNSSHHDPAQHPDNPKESSNPIEHMSEAELRNLIYARCDADQPYGLSVAGYASQRAAYGRRVPGTGRFQRPAFPTAKLAYGYLMDRLSQIYDILLDGAQVARRAFSIDQVPFTAADMARVSQSGTFGAGSRGDRMTSLVSAAYGLQTGPDPLDDEMCVDAFHVLYEAIRQRDMEALGNFCEMLAVIKVINGKHGTCIATSEAVRVQIDAVARLDIGFRNPLLDETDEAWGHPAPNLVPCPSPIPHGPTRFYRAFDSEEDVALQHVAQQQVNAGNCETFSAVFWQTITRDFQKEECIRFICQGRDAAERKYIYSCIQSKIDELNRKPDVLVPIQPLLSPTEELALFTFASAQPQPATIPTAATPSPASPSPKAEGKAASKAGRPVVPLFPDKERREAEIQRFQRCIRHHKLGNREWTSSMSDPVMKRVCCFIVLWMGRQWIPSNPSMTSVCRFIIEDCHVGCTLDVKTLANKLRAWYKGGKKVDTSTYKEVSELFT